MSVDYIWRDVLLDGCPPEQSVPCDGIFYRITQTNPPTDDDYVANFWKKPSYAQSQINTGKTTLCEAKGLSVFPDLASVNSLMQNVPNLGRFVVEMNLKPRHGKALQRKRTSSHRTFWPVNSFDPESISTVVI
jgi:hypothetical protein